MRGGVPGSFSQTGRSPQGDPGPIAVQMEEVAPGKGAGSQIAPSWAELFTTRLRMPVHVLSAWDKTRTQPDYGEKLNPLNSHSGTRPGVKGGSSR